MGLTYRTALQICKTVRGLKNRKSSLMLGYQNMRISVRTVADLVRNSLYMSLDASLYKNVIDNQETDSKLFFRLMGFEKAEALDVFNYEGADIIADLNEPVLGHDDRYDLIYNGGTLEHTSHPVNALINTARMLKPGGLLIHQTPMNNYVNHGYFQVSPILFFDFHMLNGFTDMKLFIQAMDPKGNEEYMAVDSPLALPPFESTKEYSSFFVARKSMNYTPWAFPMQTLDCVRTHVLEHFLPLIAGKRCVIWGSSGAYRQYCKPFIERHRDVFEVVGMVDSAPSLQGSAVDGVAVFPPVELDSLEPEVVLIASTYRYEIIAAMQAVSRGGYRVI